MINLQWGGHTNGQIDTSLLVDVTGKGDYLEPTAAANFLRMRADLHAATGVWITAASGSSAYRPEATQIDFFTSRYTKVSYNSGLWWNGSYWTKKAGVSVAAIPRTSNHGWARAIDITGYEDSPEAWQWLLDHAHEYGYSWATGQASGERWHWESLAAPGTVTASTTATPIPLETIMALKDSIKIFHNKERGSFLAGPALWYPIDNRDGVDGQAKLDVLEKYDLLPAVTTVEDVKEWDRLNIIFKGAALASRTLV